MYQILMKKAAKHRKLDHIGNVIYWFFTAIAVNLYNSLLSTSVLSRSLRGIGPLPILDFLRKEAIYKSFRMYFSILLLNMHIFCLSAFHFRQKRSLTMEIAPFKKPRRQNAPGNLFVDESCIDCDVCRYVHL